MKWRNLHAYVGLAATVPLLLIALSGLVLQLRNQFEAIQPATVRSSLEEGRALLPMEKVLSMFSPGEVEQVIFRPGKANYSLRLKNGHELQLHPQTGEILKDLPRRSGWLIELHQGSWLGPVGQYGIHFGAGLALLFLLLSGIKIFPFHRWRRS